VGGKHTQPLTGPSVTALHAEPAGHEPPHVGNAPPPEQCAASRRTRQRCTPCLKVQHVTAPGRPHVERDAQRFTSRTHSGDRSPFTSRSSDTARAHATYLRCVVAPAQ
jgi:hypothetical protein